MPPGDRLVFVVAEHGNGAVDRERALLDEGVHGLQPRELVGVSKRREKPSEIDRQEEEPGGRGETRPALGFPGRGRVHDGILVRFQIPDSKFQVRAARFPDLKLGIWNLEPTI